MEQDQAREAVNYADEDPGKMVHKGVGHFKPGLTTEELNAVYVDYLPVYEKNLQTLRYTGPETAAQTMKKYLPNNTEAKILDIGCGTGLVGIQLRNLGYCNVDALDPSADMLEAAKSKGLYQNLIRDKMADNTLQIETDTYDCVIMSGAMVINHVSCRSLLEMIRIVKPGGYIVNVMCHDYLWTVPEYTKLVPFVEELQSAGMWSQIERTVFPNYVTDTDGITFVHQVKVSDLPPFKSTIL